MDQQIPTSFIPKRPVSTEPVRTSAPKSKMVSIISFLAVIAVIATGLSYGGVYLWGTQLASQKIKTDTEINDARNGIGTDFLATMKRLDARISGVQALLGKHIVVTPIFQALQDTTLRNVQYKTFTYAFVPDPKTKGTLVEVTLTGTAKSYSTIALQSDAYTKSSLIRNPIFSNLTVDDKTNAISFKLVFTVLPSALSYETFVANSTL